MPYKTSMAIIPKSTFTVCIYLTLNKEVIYQSFYNQLWEAKMIIYIFKNHHTGSPGPGRKMKLKRTKTLLQLTWAGQKNGWLIIGLKCVNKNKSQIRCSASSHLSSLPLYCKINKNPTQPTTNRFACKEELFSILDALPGCSGLTECLWA